jgi:hypothetical protein
MPYLLGCGLNNAFPPIGTAFLSIARIGFDRANKARPDSSQIKAPARYQDHAVFTGAVDG